MTKTKGISEAAREVPCAEGTLRRLHRQGIVKPARDPWGRRLFGADDINAARRHLTVRRAAGSDAAA
jgi:DNA-binding transcriptional MerR regulator